MTREQIMAIYPQRAEEIAQANHSKLRWFMRAAKHGVTHLWQSYNYEGRIWAVDHVVNGAQGHRWYASAKAGADYGGPQTLRGQIRKIRRDRLYRVPGYAHDHYPLTRFVFAH